MTKPRKQGGGLKRSSLRSMIVCESSVGRRGPRTVRGERMLRFVLLMTLLDAGCSLQVKPFAGSVVAMTLAGATASAPGHHLEIWVRNNNDDVVRLDAIYDFHDDPASPEHTERLTPFGVVIRPAVRMDDPCMIDDAGHLLVTAAAYPSSTVVGGVEQTAEEQAQTVRALASALCSTSSCDGSGGDPRYHCGRQPAGLLGLFPYELVDDAGHVVATAPPPPSVPFDAAPADRLAACQAYWASSPLAYSPNPRQITAPARGVMWGVVSFASIAPTVSYDQIRIDSPTHFDEVRELFLTDEADDVDPLHRGPVYLGGSVTPAGRAVYHMDLVAPSSSTTTASGSATMWTDFDQAPSGL